MPKAWIIYFSKTGHTKKMAEAIAEGLGSTSLEVAITDVASARIEELATAEAIILGSPTYYGTMAAEMKAFIDASVKYHGKLSGKVGGAFSSSGILGGGNETTVMSLLEALLIHGMTVIGSAKTAHYGPVAIGTPSSETLADCVAYGKRLGELTKKLFC